jgi:oligosaccharyltransferase complex subunit alpha (ribophorin I)
MRLLRLLALVPLALAIEVRQHLQTGSCPQTFVNTAVARIVELGGSTVAVKTQFNVKALIDDPEVYVLALGGENNEVPAWLEVQVDSKPVENVVIDSLGG